MKVRRRASKPPRNCNAEQEQRDCGEVVFHAVSVIENPFLTGRGFRGGNAGIRPQIERMFMRSIGVLPAAEGLLAQASAAVASARPRPTTQTTNAGDLCSAIPCHRFLVPSSRSKRIHTEQVATAETGAGLFAVLGPHAGDPHLQSGITRGFRRTSSTNGFPLRVEYSSLVGVPPEEDLSIQLR